MGDHSERTEGTLMQHPRKMYSEQGDALKLRMKIKLHHSLEYRVSGKHCLDAWQSGRKMSASWRAKEERTRMEHDEVLISTSKTLSVASSAVGKRIAEDITGLDLPLLFIP